jgi:hypothetical protein
LPIETWAVGKAAYQLFARPKAFDSEELSLDVKNEDPYVFQIGDPT